MSRKRKWLIGLIILIIVLVAAGIVWRQRWPGRVTASYPQLDGQIQIAGLDGPVDVYRDEMGVPHIYASSEHDLFVAQGYVHAQDRFWEMDYQRRASSGRLSELMRGLTLEPDKFLRTVGWERIAQAEIEHLDEYTLSILEAYSEGVNAYLATHRGVEISLEYYFIGLLNPSYEPPPWTPLNTMTWAKAMAWDLRGNMDTEIDRAKLLASLTPQQVADLYPDYPEDKPVIVPDFELTGKMDIPSYTTTPGLAAAMEEVSAQFAVLDDLLGGGTMEEGVGSNNWAVSGDLTATGKPLLANDMHLNANIPHIWYEVGLHCLPKTETCPWNVAGVSFVGVPGVVEGHNDRIGWAYTNNGPDVMDLYIEKINPENPNQYEYEGQWVDMEILTETIQIGPNKTEELTVRLTRHGPIITEVYGLEEFPEESAVEMPEQFAIALRWTALEQNFPLRAILQFDLAQNWDDFREAARDFTVPAQNLVYADVDGNIGYQMPGSIPIRAGEGDGRFPLPGWTGEHEWLGYVPFDELPFVFNPPQGYIVTANNRPAGPDYPYYIADEWAYGYRAQRIIDMIVNAPGLIDISYFQQMQGDNFNQNAQDLMPVLMNTPLEDQEQIQMRELLAVWDYQEHMDSPEAALWEVFWKHLLLMTFDELPEDYTPGGGGRWFTILRGLVQDPTNAWWDVQKTDAVETRDDIFAAAFATAVHEIRKELGQDPAAWRWGDLHRIYFNHAVMDSFPFIRNAFNQGPFPVSGGSSLVNNTSWKVSGEDYRVSGVSPSQRLIVDFSDFQNTLLIHPTGQSGHSGHPNYIDMAELWTHIQYNVLGWLLEDIQANAAHHLQLKP